MVVRHSKILALFIFITLSLETFGQSNCKMCFNSKDSSSEILEELLELQNNRILFLNQSPDRITTSSFSKVEGLHVSSSKIKDFLITCVTKVSCTSWHNDFAVHINIKYIGTIINESNGVHTIFYYVKSTSESDYINEMVIGINYVNLTITSVINFAETTYIFAFSDSYFTKLEKNKIEFMKAPPSDLMLYADDQAIKIKKVKIKNTGRCVTSWF